MKPFSIIAATIFLLMALAHLYRIAGVMAEDVEMRFPVRAAISRSHRVRQRPVEGVALGDAEQLHRCVVDEVRQLLDVIVEEAIAGVEVKLALDRGHGRQVAKDDPGHGR